MIVQLSFVFSLPAHLRHSLEALEHRLDDAVVRRVHVLPDLQPLRSDHQRFGSANVDREIFDEMDYTTAFSASELRVFHAFDLLALRR